MAASVATRLSRFFPGPIMIRRPLLRRLPHLTIALIAALAASCGEAGPIGPADAVNALDLDQGQPLAAVMPDLAPETGTAGTERYVPTLQRVLRRAVGIIKEKVGKEAAANVVAEAQRLRAEVRTAKEAGDKAAFKQAAAAEERFAARVGLRVFGPSLARHVAKDAAQQLQDLMPRLRSAAEAGQDVGRLVKAAQGARKSLAAAREAWENDKPVAGLVLAARALDVATKVGALVPTS